MNHFENTTSEDFSHWADTLSYDAIQFRLIQDVIARQFHEFGYSYAKSPRSNIWYIKSMHNHPAESLKMDTFVDVLKFLFELMKNKVEE